MGKKVKIKLEVNVPVVCEAVEKTDELVQANSEMSDDNYGCSPGGRKLKDFQSIVYLGKEVEWIGKVKNQTDPLDPADPLADFKVKIEEIKRNYGPDIFGGNPKNTGGETITATVLEDTKFNNSLYGYTIYFSIYNGQDNCGSFSIDPKLQSNA